METIHKFRCDACGQIINIEVVQRLVNDTPGYCPFCGEPTLRPTRTSFNALQAPCFTGIDPKLTQLLYEVWRSCDPRVVATNFVDYWRQQLTNAVTNRKGS
jgi:NAD-dependent SIR2 family protein deacetylase